MNQIFYVSSSRKGIALKEVEEMVEKASKFNSDNGITGIMLFKSGIFLQLLEGEASKINVLFESKIKKDDRHSNIIEMFNIPTEQRMFEKWSMAFHEVSELDIKMVNEMLSWNKLISAVKEIDSHIILHMLERFKGKL
jgi:hypothetical protein